MRQPSKLILGDSAMSTFCWIVVLFPYFCFIGLFLDKGFWLFLALIFGFIFSYLFYFTIGIYGIGAVEIGANVKCFKNFTPKFRYIQGDLNFPVSEITGIEFKYLDGNSDGHFDFRMNCLPYLVFYLNDNSVRNLYIRPFSKKQLIRIEESLLKIKPDIFVFCSSKDFLK